MESDDETDEDEDENELEDELDDGMAEFVSDFDESDVDDMEEYEGAVRPFSLVAPPLPSRLAPPADALPTSSHAVRLRGLLGRRGGRVRRRGRRERRRGRDGGGPDDGQAEIGAGRRAQEGQGQGARTQEAEEECVPLSSLSASPARRASRRASADPALSFPRAQRARGSRSSTSRRPRRSRRRRWTPGRRAEAHEEPRAPSSASASPGPSASEPQLYHHPSFSLFAMLHFPALAVDVLREESESGTACLFQVVEARLLVQQQARAPFSRSSAASPYVPASVCSLLHRCRQGKTRPMPLHASHVTSSMRRKPATRPSPPHRRQRMPPARTERRDDSSDRAD